MACIILNWKLHRSVLKIDVCIWRWDIIAILLLTVQRCQCCCHTYLGDDKLLQKFPTDFKVLICTYFEIPRTFISSFKGALSLLRVWLYSFPCGWVTERLQSSGMRLFCEELCILDKVNAEVFAFSLHLNPLQNAHIFILIFSVRWLWSCREGRGSLLCRKKKQDPGTSHLISGKRLPTLQK